MMISPVPWLSTLRTLRTRRITALLVDVWPIHCEKLSMSACAGSSDDAMSVEHSIDGTLSQADVLVFSRRVAAGMDQICADDYRQTRDITRLLAHTYSKSTSPYTW